MVRVNEYTGWNKPLLVTLTSTSNPYLKDRLPARGLLTIHETATDGHAMNTKVTFQIESRTGEYGVPVHVENAEWTYLTRDHKDGGPLDLEAAGLERIMQAREAKASVAADQEGYVRGLRMAMALNGDVSSPAELGRLLRELINKTEGNPPNWPIERL